MWSAARRRYHSGMTGALDAWSEFNVAMASATAALAGLVIVAASVNIGEIVKSRTLTARLGTAIVLLLIALAVSALGLVPGIDAAWYGVLVLAMAAVALVFHGRTTVLIATDPDSSDRSRPGKYVLGFLPIVAYLISGVLMLTDHSAALYAAAVGAILSIVSAIIVSWVALVEVLR
jgi:modulator of FtsH protease